MEKHNPFFMQSFHQTSFGSNVDSNCRWNLRFFTLTQQLALTDNSFPWLSRWKTVNTKSMGSYFFNRREEGNIRGSSYVNRKDTRCIIVKHSNVHTSESTALNFDSNFIEDKMVLLTDLKFLQNTLHGNLIWRTMF